ncbi:hypothetical protein FRC14_006479 [Serendipita sp. 396]|nr:hypothetical protein FRC14_006479 [Serendipita sp. 396]KAG8824697.1 hypothetical protein FRC19_001277 [Serendipita sp. 401]KAG8829102.1 hypothetical protein FRC18_009530 [Serendipita sp. 400]KAG9054515.1 hypothetical protein FS842_004910 [Serendipita sp. 407]
MSKSRGGQPNPPPTTPSANPNAGMIFVPEPIEPVALFTGAVLYPLAEVLELARGIIANLERHHRILLQVAQEQQDDQEELIQLNNLVDINLTIYAVDPLRWKESVEENNPYHVWSEKELEGLTHPRKAEEGLLGLSRIPRAEFVIQAAIERRKTKRGIPPPDDAYWRKEDALMNLLQFFSNWCNAGLFVPS